MIADYQGKICPSCGTVNLADAGHCTKWGCKHSFAGDEIGARPERIRIETEAQTLTDAQIRRHLAVAPNLESDNCAHQKDAECLRHRVLFRARLAALSVLLIALGGYVKASLLVGPQAPNSAVWTVLAYGALAGGALLLIVTAAQIGRCLLWYLRGPDVATPEEIVGTFYTGLGMGDDEASVGHAWACLDPLAQSAFRSIDDFETYWEKQLNELKLAAVRETAHVWSGHRPKRARGEINCRFSLGTTTVTNVTTQSAELHTDILVEAYDLLVVGSGDDAGTCEICYGELAVPQSKTLLKNEGRWYLTSGTLECPELGARRSAQPHAPEMNYHPA